MTRPNAGGVEELRAPVLEPDEDVLGRRLRLAAIEVIGIEGDVDAALPVFQGREDVGVPIQRWHLDVLDDRDLIG
jgi:hypothetical protein